MLGVPNILEPCRVEHKISTTQQISHLSPGHPAIDHSITTTTLACWQILYHVRGALIRISTQSLRVPFANMLASLAKPTGGLDEMDAETHTVAGYLAKDLEVNIMDSENGGDDELQAHGWDDADGVSDDGRDSEEEELERLVFGTSQDFKAQLGRLAEATKRRDKYKDGIFLPGSGIADSDEEGGMDKMEDDDVGPSVANDL